MKKIVGALLLTASMSYATGMFSIGHKNFGFHIGQGSAYGNDYTVIGANINYFIIDNLSTGIGFQTWLGDDPTINQFSIPLTYYIPIEGMFRPYVGAFYSHTLVGDDKYYDYNDYDSYGGHVGVSMQTSPSSYVSFGWVQEVHDDGVDKESRGYPQISGGLSF